MTKEGLCILNLPTLIKGIYGVFEFTGLYSFEFVDKNRNTITEIFFMIPPKSKTVEEPTRSSTVPTLGGNYNIDGGNATKNITLSGELYFPYVGSPDNPVAKNNEGLENTMSGLESFLALRFMLIRYRDYTLTKDSTVTIPTTAINASNEIATLYKKVSENVKNKTGALYDEIQLIFHDYDMDDHFYCRVDSFSSDQSDVKHIAINYTINIECYEPDTGQKPMQVAQVKPEANESVDVILTQIDLIAFDESLDTIQADIGYNKEFLSASSVIEIEISNLTAENEKIQAGTSTPLTLLPIYVSSILSNTNTALDYFTDTFLSPEQKIEYDAGDLTIDDIVSKDLLLFYNDLQKVKLQIISLQGVLNAIPVLEDIRYSTGADDYTLTEEQFDDPDSSVVQGNSNFYYYTVMQGDTARVVALRELKDPEKFVNILEINSISDNDFMDGSIIGQQIKIPIIASVVARSNDNLIYEADFSNIEKFLYGSDLATGLNNELLISATGDLLSEDGIENAYDNIESRINNNKGSLNVFNPNWGTIAIDDSNAPLMVKIDRYLTDVIEQLQADPRVESVKMDLDKLDWNGEKISFSSNVYFIGTEESREVTI